MRILNFEVGLDNPFFLIAGPCVIESEKLCLDVAEKMREMTERLGINYVFKASFDKANRSALQNFRGPGLEEGLRILEKVKREIGVPVITDVHEKEQAKPVAEVVDMLQTPAFLCRQTDFIQAVAAQGKPVNMKKGQFIAPDNMGTLIEKALATGNDKILACERGASFGYNNLVVDMRSFAIMRKNNCPVVADVTHSVQRPGSGTVTGGDRQFVPLIARAAAAVGVAGFFMETHPDPEKALSDATNMWPLDKMEELLKVLQELDAIAKSKVDLASEQ